MAGFGNAKQMADAQDAGKYLYASFRKQATQTTGAGVWFDLSMSPGNPAPNYYIGSPGVFTRMAQSTDGGLRHGGNVNCNYKPNYNSVMNYRYQFSGGDTNCSVAGDGLTSYSVGTRPSLDENALNENAGICGLAAGVPVDWNNNGMLQNPVIVDINSNDSGQVANCGGTLTTLGDYNDLANLNLAHIRTTPDAPQEVIDCTNEPPH